MAASGLTEETDESESVINLLRFAGKLFTCIDNINAEIKTFSFTKFELRIGISHGEVTAGVVGSKKPLYDIWGDAVNMASRMDTLGEIGKIQITQNTAEAIRKRGILSTFRGNIYVKGKSSIPSKADVPTYYVQLDQNNELINENYNK